MVATADPCGELGYPNPMHRKTAIFLMAGALGLGAALGAAACGEDRGGELKIEDGGTGTGKTGTGKTGTTGTGTEGSATGPEPN